MSALPPGKLALFPDSVETDADKIVESAPDATDGSARPGGKPGRSGPPGNKNARTHGMYALKRAVQERGLEAIDGRSALGRALASIARISFVTSVARRSSAPRRFISLR